MSGLVLFDSAREGTLVVAGFVLGLVAAFIAVSAGIALGAP